MKKKLRTLFALTLMSGVAAWSVPAGAQDAVQAGVSAAVRGAVQVARADAVGRRISSGEAIFMRDAITSGSDAGMQILLMDETVFTIGPDSEISIDEFVYDPNTGDGSLAANMTKGVMRFVTGKVSDGNPDSMVIKLPVGTIGIRGTIGLISVLTPQQANAQFPDQAPPENPQAPNQPVVFAALTGPGPLNQTGAGTGSFTFSSPNGSVDLNRPGGAVLATPGQPPVFFIAPPGAINNLSQPLNGRGSQSGNAGDGNGNDGGNDTGGQGGGGTQQSGGNSSSGSGTSQSSTGSASSQSGASKDTSFSQVMTVSTNTNNASQTNDVTTGASSANSSSTTFGDIIDANANSTAISSSDSPLSGDITGKFNTYIDLSARTFDIQFRDLNGGGLGGNDTFRIKGGSTSLSNSATGLTVGGSGGVASDGTCSSCQAVVTFTGTNSLSSTLTNNGVSGSGTATLTDAGS